MKAPKDSERGLSIERLRAVLSYEPASGTFVWRERISIRIMVGNVAGRTRRDGYKVIGVDGHLYLAHRLAWFHVHGEWPKSGIDHIDGNPSNNALRNLREATPSENHGNLKILVTNTSGYTGAWFHKRNQRWTADIWHQKRKYYLGSFATKEEASDAYQEAHQRLFGAFTRAA